MDWTLAVKRNTGELLQLVLGLFACLGSGAVSRDGHLRMLRTLRGLEAAFRRLVVVAARGVFVTLRRRAGPVGNLPSGGRCGLPAVPLFDPRKSFMPRRVSPVSEPRLTVIGVDPWQAQPMAGAGAALPDPGRMRQRLLALQAALSDLPKQVRRLARLRARRDLRLAAGEKVGPASPMRPGWPPGYRRDGGEAIRALLLDLCGLARLAENEGEKRWTGAA